MSNKARTIDEILSQALAEDIGSGDLTSLGIIDPDAAASGVFLAKASGVLAGTKTASRVFSILDKAVAVEWSMPDGETVSRGDVLGKIAGNARAILSGERTALNILQRMSGIASATRELVSAVRGTNVIILDTRKTAPGLRVLDKLAVIAGGGANHRFGLDDMILIKDNHIASAGGIASAISRARDYLNEHPELEAKIEVETRTIAEVREVIAHLEETGDPDRVMLDNMVHVGHDGSVDTTMLREAVTIVGGRIETEASGNVTPETAAKIAKTGVDFISSGSLTHSVKALDISLEIEL